MSEQNKTLYQRLGGYDAIAACLGSWFGVWTRQRFRTLNMLGLQSR